MTMMIVIQFIDMAYSNNLQFTAIPVGLGPPQLNKGIDRANRVIMQITLSSFSNPEWAQGRSYSQNLEMCIRMCIAFNECKGIQVSL